MKARSILRATVLAGAVLASTGTWAQDAPAPNPERRGERLFLQCRACHSVTKEQEGKIGPALAGVVGRKAGAVPGFTYSKALASSGLTWDEATLDKWLAQPSTLVPGTAMVFVGLPKPEDRQAIVAYLKKVAAAP
jgi:cytochrome c